MRRVGNSEFGIGVLVVTLGVFVCTFAYFYPGNGILALGGLVTVFAGVRIARIGRPFLLVLGTVLMAAGVSYGGGCDFFLGAILFLVGATLGSR
jgi:hypothetical protein